jgi:hypothetical protein
VQQLGVSIGLSLISSNRLKLAQKIIFIFLSMFNIDIIARNDKRMPQIDRSIVLGILV